MSPEEMKVVVQGLFKEFWNQGDADSLRKYMATDHIDHSFPPDQAQGLEPAIQYMQGVHASFPDFRITIEDQIIEADKIVTRWVASGTLASGEWLGVPANGKTLHNKGIGINRIMNGKIVESWGMSDNYGMLEQLGALPKK